MRIGTRVTHTRYTWMVGIVRSVTADQAMVFWLDGRTGPKAEQLSDLRATPIQPYPVKPRA